MDCGQPKTPACEHRTTNNFLKMPKTDRYFTIEQAKNNYNLFITQILAHEKKKRKKKLSLTKA